ncbi:MAG: zinc metalloprotease HtpX [Brevinematia bacterium]
MFSLTMRMIFIIGALFGILYLVIALVGEQGVVFNLVVAGIILLIQYLISPKIVEWTMRVRYVSESEEPELHRMVEELARNAGIPKPRVGISDMPIVNAFAFGRSIRDGRVVVTSEIMRVLSRDELRAVLGHEVTHIKNRDMIVMTIVSVIPMVLYNLAFFFMHFGGNNRESGSMGALIGIFMLLLYFVSNLLVLAISRVREYLADYGSVKLGNPPRYLASALYKIVYSSAVAPEEDKAQVSGMKAFFLNDPNSAESEITELVQLDRNKDLSIDESELQQIRRSRVKISLAEKLMELFTTHPNMLKRIKKLSEYV